MADDPSKQTGGSFGLSSSVRSFRWRYSERSRSSRGVRNLRRTRGPAFFLSYQNSGRARLSSRAAEARAQSRLQPLGPAFASATKLGVPHPCVLCKGGTRCCLKRNLG